MASPGAYGLRIDGLGAAERLLVDAPGSWPDWHIVRSRGGAPGEDHVGPDSASIALTPEGRLTVDRPATTATIAQDIALADEEVVHPYLAPVAAIAARWAGREGIHGGAFLVAGRAWVVLGDAASGKSTLLASLARRGTPIVADDLVVTDGQLVYSGPRCVDLREDMARVLGVGRPLGVVGGRERWRVDTGPVAAEPALGGIVTLGWGDSLAVATVPPAERLPRVMASRSLLLEPLAPEILLDLATLPMIELRRPRDSHSAAAVADRLIDETGTHSA